MKISRETYKPAGAIEIKDKRCSAVAYVGTSRHSGKPVAVGFSGKRSKPDFNYSFPDPARAFAYVRQHADGVLATEKMRQEHAAKRAAEKCTTPLQVWEKGRRTGYISATDAAICLRAALAAHFPGVKFSVRADSSLNVTWTDGPSYNQVKEVAGRYSFEGFDGMIDLRYSLKRWLARDGSISLAHNEGTTCSMGTVSEAIGDPHAPDAVLVSGGADFVFCRRERSPAAELALAQVVCRKYGLTMPDSFANDTEMRRWINSARVESSNGPGEYLATLMHQHESQTA